MKRRIVLTQDAVGNPNLELTLYGPDTDGSAGGCARRAARLLDRTGNSPIAATLAGQEQLHRSDRPRAIAVDHANRSLHVLHPVVKLPDGTLLAGSTAIIDGRRFSRKRGLVRQSALVSAGPAKTGDHSRSEKSRPEPGG